MNRVGFLLVGMMGLSLGAADTVEPAEINLIGESAVWQAEQRDVLADYENFFGESPREISGVAIMVDTDNTDSRAEADFSELSLEISPTPEVSIP